MNIQSLLTLLLPNGIYFNETRCNKYKYRIIKDKNKYNII